MVVVQKMGMTFKVRHCLCIEKGHGILTQAKSFHITQSSTVTSLFAVWVPTNVSVGQTLSVPMYKVYCFRINR